MKLIDRKTDALRQFQDAYNNLLDEFDKDEMLNTLDSVGLYPFSKSFDELNVNLWVEESIAELNLIWHVVTDLMADDKNGTWDESTDKNEIIEGLKASMAQYGETDEH